MKFGFWSAAVKTAMLLGQTLVYNVCRDMPSTGQRTGIANLPLHYGKVPPWLFGTNGCVLDYDWHPSDITATIPSVLKEEI